jgi:hypothetical protein
MFRSIEAARKLNKFVFVENPRSSFGWLQMQILVSKSCVGVWGEES